MSGTVDEWFVREVLPHESALQRYLTRVWPNKADIPDIRHDAYVRILEAADRLRPIAPKSLLFSIARNLMIDRARRHRIVPIDLWEDLDSLNLLVDEVTPERRASIRQQLVRVTAAFNQLPDKCREVLWLRRVEGRSQKEICARLGISEGTVEKHMMRAARLLANLLTEVDPAASRTGPRAGVDEDRSHGK
jgi:RNA polymerase sigma factor (sigma-70 family)